MNSDCNLTAGLEAVLQVAVGARVILCITDLSELVFCPGMTCVALSKVKQLENLHLMVFHKDAIKLSTKCLQGINHLRQT